MTAAKKTRTTGTKKSPASKGSPKKASAKKKAAKKAGAKKAGAKKPSAKKTAAKKGAARRGASQKATTRRGTNKTEASPASTRRTSPPDVEFDTDTLDFIEALDAFKLQHNKPFPSWSEVLWIIKQLGYRKA